MPIRMAAAAANPRGSARFRTRVLVTGAPFRVCYSTRLRMRMPKSLLPDGGTPAGRSEVVNVTKWPRSVFVDGVHETTWSITNADQPMMWKYQTEPMFEVVSNTGKKSGTPSLASKPCLIGPTFCPVLTPYHWLDGSSSGSPLMIQFFRSCAPTLLLLAQAGNDVAWHVRLIRPIVLEATALSSKLTVFDVLKQLGTMHATVFFTATGATFLKFCGTVTAAVARALSLRSPNV